MAKLYSKETLGIKTIDHLELRLSIPIKALVEASSKAEDLYIYRKKPKENGKFRTISAPKPFLKRIQSKIHKLLQELMISEFSHGGVKGRSNLTNAKIHTGNKELYSLDFKNFYPGISHQRIYRLFCCEFDCSPDVARMLTRLCTVRGEVPQGSPTSSDLANLVHIKPGKRLSGLAKKYQINNYSHYIDDLSFSGQVIPSSFKKTAKEIIAQHGFELNLSKEISRGRHQSQIVTGVCVNNKKITLPKKTSRKWRAEKYILRKFKSKEMTADMRLKEEQRVKGRDNYIRNIESKG